MRITTLALILGLMIGTLLGSIASTDPKHKGVLVCAALLCMTVAGIVHIAWPRKL